MKVLVSAYACEPSKGSEPGVGWYWSRQIARFHEVYVITRANNRQAIERELQRKPEPNLRFYYINLPKCLSFWKRGQKGIYLYYYLWQILAYFLARRLHKGINFDAVHHITFGNVWMPTLMPLLNVPFIWGPVGGAELVPHNLRTSFDLRSRLYEKVRDFLLVYNFRLDPFTKITMDKASLILARTTTTARAFPLKYRKKIHTMIETGVSQEFMEQISLDGITKNANTILMAGRLLHWKGFDLGIEAFSLIAEKHPEVRLIIVGSGPMENHLKKLADSLKQDRRVHFAGHEQRHKLLARMAAADIFLFPSMKDAGAWVLFEAMAAGLPIVCLDYAGPGEIVSDASGTRVGIGSRSKVIREISEALDALLSSEKLRSEMSHAARERLNDLFLWETKGDMMSKLYQEISN